MQKAHLPGQIQGSRIVLRQHRAEFAELIFSYVERDRERLNRYLSWIEFTRTLDDVLSYISLATLKWEAHEMYDYGIFETVSGHYIGNLGVHSISWDHQKCEIGYWLLGEFEGRGFMTEAVALLEKTCFELGFHRIEIRCAPDNARAWRLPQRSGYRLEAHLHEDTLDAQGRRDTLVFSKLRGQGAGGGGLLGLEAMYLFCAEFEAVKAWYTRVLGAPPVRELSGYAEFRPGGMSGLVISSRDGGVERAPQGVQGYWRTLDIEHSVQHFKKFGASVRFGPTEIKPGSTMCIINDPFGHGLGLIQEPI